MRNFVHLNCHSHFSLMWGTASPEALCEAMRTLGLETIALTDTNGLYGLHWFLESAKGCGLRPIIGAELVTPGERAVILARNAAGYSTLCALLTARHRDPEFHLSGRLQQSPSPDIIILSDSLSVLQALRGRPHLYAELRRGRHYALLKQARAWHIPPVATSPVYLLTRENHAVHTLLRAIDLNTSTDRVPPQELVSPDAVPLGPDAMARAFPHCPEALDNAAAVAAACATDWDFSKIVFPKIYNDAAAFRLLRAKCQEGIIRRYGRSTPALAARLDYELSVIGRMGYAHYFLVVEDIVKQSALTCGRGSAAASLVSYLLGITHVDPMQYNLFFERFLNTGRKDPPDIDVDFAWDERDDVLAYIFETYPDRAAMVANHVYLQPRAAFRETAKVYGMPEAEIKTFTDRLRHVWAIRDVEQVVRHHPMFRNLALEDVWLDILEKARTVSGVPRHLSVHCGGVVITPRPIEQYAPLQTAPKGVPILQWEKDQTEAAGLVKIDILGNRSLAVIRDTLRAIRAHYNVTIDYAAFNPLEDLRTRELITSGHSLGCFYIESPATRLLLQKTRSGDFENLVVVSSIVRPAANREAREYVRRLHGGPWEGIHPIVEDVLKETFGIMVYQEDVSRVAIALADFSPAEADELRKVLTKKHRQKRLKDFFERFVHGARGNGVPDAVIQRVWESMLSFVGYSFCKPHSASYALVSFKSAYLKAHYPAEFYAAVISNQGGFYRTFAYCNDAKRQGLELRPPDINESRREYTGMNNWLRIGFMQLKALRDRAVDRILEERENGPFASLNDFLRRTGLDCAAVKILIRAGCFDTVSRGRTRPELMWELLQFEARRTRTPQISLLEDPTAPEVPETDEYSAATLLQHEADSLGFLASRHPLTLYEDRLKNLPFVYGKNLPACIGKYVTVIGWFVTAKLTSTKTEEPMQFASFEDTTALYEVTFFPKAYQKFCWMIGRDRPFILRGKVEEDFGAVMLIVNDLRFLDERKEPGRTIDRKSPVRWHFHPV